MGTRQAIIAILSVPAVFLVCFTMLGMANLALRMILILTGKLSGTALPKP